MSDLKPDGTRLEVKPADPEEANKTVTQSEQPSKPELKSPAQGFELIPSYTRHGNEAIAIVKMLESINRNLAFLAQTIHLHLNPEVKDGRPEAKR